MPYGKAIELFLVDGDANGLITAELSNWNGKAIKVPRTDVKECHRTDTADAGVYFLFCQEEDSFAVKYYEIYKDPNTTYVQVDGTFGDEAFDLGFKMDGGNSFSEVYDGHALFDYRELEKIIDKVDDIRFLGTAIFSAWRYYNHRSNYEHSTDPKPRKWFVIALSKLAKLSI